MNLPLNPNKCCLVLKQYSFKGEHSDTKTSRIAAGSVANMGDRNLPSKMAFFTHMA